MPLADDVFDAEWRERAVASASACRASAGLDLVVATQVLRDNNQSYFHTQTWHDGRLQAWDIGLSPDAAVLLVRSEDAEHLALNGSNDPVAEVADTSVQVVASGEAMALPPLGALHSAPWRQIKRATVRAAVILRDSPFGDLSIDLTFVDGALLTGSFGRCAQSDVSIELPAEAGYLLLAADLLLSQIGSEAKIEGSIAYISCLQGILHQDEYVAHTRRFAPITNFFARYSALSARPDVKAWRSHLFEEPRHAG